jgi:ketosteroid isomerase-like protein
MLARDEALSRIHEAYAARVRGDKEALSRYWAEGATFRIAGTPSLVRDVPLSGATPMDAIEKLIDQFTFSDLTLLDSVVDGNKVAAHWQVTITPAKGTPETTQLFDLIELDDDGKIKSLTQFADTALIRHMAG